MWANLICIFLGGGVGSLIRFWFSSLHANSNSFPWGTFCSNIAACACLGMIYGVMEKNALSLNWKLALITGFCGGFSTFSTLIYEIYIYIQQENYALAILYPMLSIVIGIIILISVKSIIV